MLFITLMAPKGKGADAVRYIKELKAPKGVKIRDVYFTFGKYDGVMIFEAPDEGTAMSFIMETCFATEYTMETLVAVPAGQVRIRKPK